MKNILLVLSTSGASQEAIDYSVERALKEKAKLYALYVLESELANELFDTFTDIGFIGDKPSEQLSKAIMKEYRQRGYEELGKVQIKAMEAGVGFEPILEKGELVPMVLEIAGRVDASLIVLVRRKAKSVLKIFARSFEDDIRKKAQCEVVVFTGSAKQ